MGEPVLITDANRLPVIFNCFLAQASQKPSHLRHEESETQSKTIAKTRRYADTPLLVPTKFVSLENHDRVLSFSYSFSFLAKKQSNIIHRLLYRIAKIIDGQDRTLQEKLKRSVYRHLFYALFPIYTPEKRNRTTLLTSILCSIDPFLHPWSKMHVQILTRLKYLPLYRTCSDEAIILYYYY